MKWYKKYLTTYDRSFSDTPYDVIEYIKIQIERLKDNNPIVSIVIIAHNEEKHILSCIWSLCENIHHYPAELIVVNNNSTDKTEDILKELNVTYYNETKKGPGFARQCGLNNSKGKFYLCIDSDTLYPPYYIDTMVKALLDEKVACAYSLWSFIPDERRSKIGMFIYESLRDIYLSLQHYKRPELNVRGMIFAFKTELGKKEGFRTDIIRGEDGSLALGLKKYGKIMFIRNRKARAITGYGTIVVDGSLWNSFRNRVLKGIKNIRNIATSQSEYKDSDSNLIK